MNATWPNLTEKLDRVHRQALRIIAEAATKVGVEWFLTGAMARDLIFTLIHGVDTLRATRDADIGIALAGWGEFERIRAEIIGSGEFEADRTLHRVNHTLIKGFHIDLVPFGQLGGENAEIAWPPDQDHVMNVIGFEEAFEAAITVLADTDLSVKVASPAGLMLMKLFAWEDRKRTQPGKDAMDIRLLLTTYEKVAGRDLWDVEGLMEAEDYDPDKAAARLLGMDVASILKPRTKEVLQRILDRELDEAGNELLLEQMVTGIVGRIRPEAAYRKTRALLTSFSNGLR